MKSIEETALEIYHKSISLKPSTYECHGEIHFEHQYLKPEQIAKILKDSMIDELVTELEIIRQGLNDMINGHKGTTTLETSYKACHKITDNLIVKFDGKSTLNDNATT